MRPLLHMVLAGWFLASMTMAQACVAPAQSAHNYGSATAGAHESQYDRAQRIDHLGSGGAATRSTAGYVADADASTALTDYLKHHRLPLVGAQVLRNPSTGDRTVTLYGFVGSDFGKADAQRRAEDYVNDPSVEVDNRIRVNPELLAAGSSTGGKSGAADNSAAGQADASMPGVQSYIDQQDQTAQVQQYQQQNSLGTMSSMLPLIALLGMLSMAAGSGGYSTGPSFGYSPYGASPYANSPYGYSPPYRPYAPYSSPLPPSYGSGAMPFGTLPGSPYRAYPFP